MICLVCRWEDDNLQLRWPALVPGANRVSLIAAQRNYKAFGACEDWARAHVRPPLPDEPLDPAWRPIDLTRDDFEDWDDATDRAPWPEDRTVLYWWLPTFWRRNSPTR